MSRHHIDIKEFEDLWEGLVAGVSRGVELSNISKKARRGEQVLGAVWREK